MFCKIKRFLDNMSYILNSSASVMCMAFVRFVAVVSPMKVHLIPTTLLVPFEHLQ